MLFPFDWAQLFFSALNRSAQSSQLHRFHQIVGNPALKSSNGVLCEGGHGDDRPGELNPGKKVKPVLMSQSKIEKNQIDRKSGQYFLRLGKGLSLADDAYFRNARKQVAQILATKRLVIDQESLERFHLMLNQV